MSTRRRLSVGAVLRVWGMVHSPAESTPCRVRRDVYVERPSVPVFSALISHRAWNMSTDTRNRTSRQSPPNLHPGVPQFPRSGGGSARWSHRGDDAEPDQHRGSGSGPAEQGRFRPSGSCGGFRMAATRATMIETRPATRTHTLVGVVNIVSVVVFTEVTFWRWSTASREHLHAVHQLLGHDRASVRRGRREFLI
jgi:hypothetical protein